MPKIGMRIFKSSFAVFSCFIIYLLRHEQGIVFYSCIAAVLCIQQTTTNTIKVARNRVEGTLIGGFSGMLILTFIKQVIPLDWLILPYIIIAFMMIPIIYSTVLLRNTSASYISCVVFMSITISHGQDVNPMMFAFDRMLDTFIGIFVAYIINYIHIPYRKHGRDIHYIELALLQDGNCVDAYYRIKWNMMEERGVQLGIFTKETPGVFMTQLQDFTITRPLIGLYGTFTYDMKQQKYLHVRTFDDETYQNVVGLLKDYEQRLFTYVVVHDVLHIYYQELSNTNQEYYESVRKQPYENYVWGTKPLHLAPCALMLLLPKEDSIHWKNKLHVYAQVACYIKEWNKDMNKLFIVMKHNDSQLIRKELGLQVDNVLHMYHNGNCDLSTKLADVSHHVHKETLLKELNTSLCFKKKSF